ncbi:hypothetical protein F7R91_39355 [Streptomyces luteolifulvus]|uniref:Uncharacterized protein n=1 Tax=Streptomyces luteolifulvus TaxID=2615112 RepID=A0A6H9UNL7_9ACTN|nr:hypothetical protein [Streptomyces luteolifulvus]KAB1139560.1 hypothetical protein F7R91_39355 [Streptomyces luteolifulvus]
MTGPAGPDPGPGDPGPVIFMEVVAAALFCAFALLHVALFLTPEAWRESAPARRSWRVLGALGPAAIAVLAVLLFYDVMAACRADKAACPRPATR